MIWYKWEFYLHYCLHNWRNTELAKNISSGQSLLKENESEEKQIDSRREKCLSYGEIFNLFGFKKILA